MTTSASIVAQLACICAVVGCLIHSSLVAMPRVTQFGESHFSEHRGAYRQ